MKKAAKVALALFGAALVLGVAACSNGSDKVNSFVPTAPVNGGSGGGTSPATATYTVTFDTDGGSAVTSQTVTAGQKAARPAAEPTKSGDKTSYVFLGWYKSDLSAPFDFDTAINETTTIKAKWLEGFVTVPGSTVVGGDKFKDASSNAGVFVAGRSVAISTFWMSDHEVTQAEYQAVMGTNPSHFKNGPAAGETQEKRPVETVSWYDVLVYCNKKSIAERLEPCYTINGKTNPAEWGDVPTSYKNVTWDAATCDFTKKGYRLPTEAEWEYAARGGKAGCEADNPTDWAGTDDSSELGKYAWYGTSAPHEVKTKAKNSLGIYDMSGNVWEWCWDWADIIDASTPVTGASSGSDRVYCGSCFGNPADYCTVALGAAVGPECSSRYHGFRVVRTAN